MESKSWTELSVMSTVKVLLVKLISPNSLPWRICALHEQVGKIDTWFIIHNSKLMARTVFLAEISQGYDKPKYLYIKINSKSEAMTLCSCIEGKIKSCGPHALGSTFP